MVNGKLLIDEDLPCCELVQEFLHHARPPLPVYFSRNNDYLEFYASEHGEAISRPGGGTAAQR